MYRCVLLVYASAMSLTSACGRSEAREPDRVAPTTNQTESAPTSPDVRGLYLGVSGDEAWFIYMEPGSAASTMWRPRQALALCDVKTDTGGAVTFRSAAGADYPFQFAGRLSHDTLVGTIATVEPRTGAVRDSWSIAPRRVLARFVTEAPNSVSGLYTSFDEGSDISGREIVLLDLAGHVVGFAQDWEGGPTTVWAITGNRVGDTLHLTWRSVDGFFVNTLLIRGDTLTGNYGSYRMPRRSSIPELFGAQNRAECK